MSMALIDEMFVICVMQGVKNSHFAYIQEENSTLFLRNLKITLKGK